ncbi:MAG TPA: hypothetical protein VKT80_13110, partial [Chloroflexota bacterium]|nr:hypothetical protein [Chloroflexota bacterium]
AIDVPLRLENTYPNFLGTVLTSAAWLIGIVVPLLLGTAVGFAAQSYQKDRDQRATEKAAFDDYVRKNDTALDQVFTTYLTDLAGDLELKGNAVDFAAQLRDKLKEHGLETVPRRERAALLAALADRERARIFSALAATYPRWRNAIEKARDV